MAFFLNTTPIVVLILQTSYCGEVRFGIWLSNTTEKFENWLGCASSFLWCLSQIPNFTCPQNDVCTKSKIDDKYHVWLKAWESLECFETILTISPSKWTVLNINTATPSPFLRYSRLRVMRQTPPSTLPYSLRLVGFILGENIHFRHLQNSHHSLPSLY